MTVYNYRYESFSCRSGIYFSSVNVNMARAVFHASRISVESYDSFIRVSHSCNIMFLSAFIMLVWNVVIAVTTGTSSDSTSS